MSEAERLGFTLAGVAVAGPSPGYGAFLDWISGHRYGEMVYLERQAAGRKDPRLLLSGAQSLLVLGMNYFIPEEPVRDPLRGRISRYAAGRDYHEVVLARLQELLGYIRKRCDGAEGRCYVDTGPVMEKPWGCRSGLGWIGKHTNLISKRVGSWFFVGVILLNVALEPDMESENHCGTCRRCMDACPTGAIVAPYSLDARLCLSYLTIEFRGLVPRDLRPLLGNRIFGCDSCQEACPWNRFSRKTTEERFLPRPEFLDPDLTSLSRLTGTEFKRLFRDSPVYRATRDGLVRNVVTALGNSGDPGAVGVLVPALEDESPIVRATAAWALVEVAPRKAGKILRGMRQRERDPLVLGELNGLL